MRSGQWLEMLLKKGECTLKPYKPKKDLRCSVCENCILSISELYLPQRAAAPDFQMLNNAFITTLTSFTNLLSFQINTLNRVHFACDYYLCSIKFQNKNSIHIKCFPLLIFLICWISLCAFFKIP